MATVQVTRSVTATNLLQQAYPSSVNQVTAASANMTWYEFGREIQLGFKLSDFPAAYRYKKLEAVDLVVTAHANAKWSARPFYNFGLAAYNAASLSWDSRELTDQTGVTTNTVDKTQGAAKSFSVLGTADQAATLARAAGVILSTPYGFNRSTVDVASFYTQAEGTASYRPRLEFSVDDAITITSQIEQQNSPTGGYVDRQQAQTFAWRFVPTGPCAGDFSQASATFYWRAGSSGAYTAVAAASQSVAIPANTFPAGTIQWYVEGTDNTGATSSTPVYTFTTADTTTFAAPISPINEIVDGSAPIEFRWSSSNSYGKAPSSSELQYSADAITWLPLGTVTGAGLTYTAPANFLPSGAVYWRVRAFNQDDVAGPWSEAASLRNVAAPPAPSVITDAAPFTTISWAASEQQAYRITVDGEFVGTFFGTDHAYTLEDYLEDGVHTVSVAVQNVYGLWSTDGSTSFQVTNQPGAAITLSGAFALDADLSWTGGSGETYLIYRDGKRIAETSAESFTDRLVLGGHSWAVVEKLADGNYTRSNEVSGELSTDDSQIAAITGGAWLSLRLSEFSNGEQSFSSSRAFTLRHVAGARYPILELAPFYDRQGSYNASFTDPAAVAALEALLGRVVILKSRRGNVVIGLLAQLDKRETDFYTAFTFAIQQIEWEDYVHDAGT